MKRKQFLSTIAHASAGAVVFGQIGCQASAKTSENLDQPILPSRWLWLRPSLETTDDEWRQHFEEIKGLGIEAVLPQIFASNKALFQIDDYEVEAPLLERLIPLAHEAGLEIHAWMWTMPCNNPRIISEHPDWYVVNRLGQPAHSDPAYVTYYKFLCPRRPEVRSFVQQRVQALANIAELDGIHLDYVRMPDVILAEGLQPKYDIVQDQEYPQYDYCYCDYCRSSYQEKTGIDPMTISDPAADASWYQHRYDAVIGLVNEYCVPVARSANKMITAAVFPNWESVRQQWHRFDLDGFLPMLYQGFYNEDLNWIGVEVAKALDRLDHQKPVYSGLFLPHLPTADSLKDAIAKATSAGAKGFALFSYNDIKEEHKSALFQLTE